MTTTPFADAFGDLNAALDAAGNAVILLPLSRIVEDPDNPRSSFDEGELAALAATLRNRGVLQPIIVRPPDDGGVHMIRFGARRFRAAKLAGLTEISAIVQAGQGDEADLLVQQLIENEQREDLSTADLARAVDRLLAMKLSQSEIARRLGRPREQVVMLAAVRNMPPELQRLAADLGLRTLYELHGAWKSNPGRTRLWLTGRDPRQITQAAARGLADRPVATRQVVRDPSEGSVRHAPEPRPSASPSSATGTLQARREPTPNPPKEPSREGVAVFEVKARGVRGELVLDNVRAPSVSVLVRLKDGSLQSVASGDIRIVRVRPG